MAHPNVLFMDFQHCKAKQQTNSSCKHLEKLARILQATVMSLKEDPLAFGQEVIKLEEHCANIVTNQHEDKLCHENLPEKLAVIRWLESPENKI
ncbi:MAG: hypothetical protein A3F18_02565 [Legionellales bacterium RIFCSPHIGHO2_12_FULL_37_14]|nr:MAG: hypothetical protein A3F18_02565 [Legionellales bacterium RIFCSPHIGHO2_12_FULL_37_14]